MPVDPRMRAQIQLILNSLAGAEAFPTREQWRNADVNDVDYLYRKNTILVRERDAARVIDAITRLFPEEGGQDVAQGEEPSPPPFDPQPVTAGVLSLTLPDRLPVPVILN